MRRCGQRVGVGGVGAHEAGGATGIRRAVGVRAPAPNTEGVRRLLPLLIICASFAAPVAVAAAEPVGPGDRGRAVKVVQRALGLPADGIFGPATARAVRRFQRAEDLAVTGRVDGRTRAALLGDDEPGRRRDGEATAPGGGGASVPSAEGGIVGAARQALGRPYKAGATGPKAFDCSGLVVWAADAVGIDLPRSSFAQYEVGTRVARGAIAAGDLVFFDTNGPGASDVGIAVSATEAISATTHGVREHEIFGPYWGDHYVGARRLGATG